MKKRTTSATVLTLSALTVLGVSAVLLGRAAPSEVDVSHELSANVTPSLEPTVTESTSGRYDAIKVTTSTPGAEIARAVGLSHVRFVLTFNRLDEKHIRSGTTIVIPPTGADWNALSPFPKELPAAQDIEKLLVVSQEMQAIGAYEHGTLVRWMVTSTGKKDTPTPSKLYFTNWKGKLVKSTLEGDYMLPWAFNLDSMEGIALHEFDLPGYPASHACIRLLEEDAMWIYDWAEQWILDASGQTELAKGTPVIVFGEYRFGKPAPWRALVQDPHANDISVDDLTEVLKKYSDEIHKAAEQRAEVEATQ